MEKSMKTQEWREFDWFVYGYEKYELFFSHSLLLIIN